VKIIYLHQYFLTPDMPGGHRSYEMARRLVQRGHEVHMITSAQGGLKGRSRWRESVENGIHVHWANVPYSNHMSPARRILSFLQFSARATFRACRLKGDVIFATSTPLTIAIPAMAASLVRHTPFVFEVRDMWPDVPAAMGILRNPVLLALARRLERLAYTRARHVVALAPGMRDDIIAKGIAADHVSVIPNGCDVDLFAARRDDSLEAEFQWIRGRRLVVYAGAIGPVNGVEYLVRLAARVRELAPDICFVVIGAGRDRAAVRALAATCGVLDDNFVMLDPLPARELARWLGAATMATALITGPRIVWKDAVQNKFFDALAAGIPVASNFDGWQSRIAEDAGVGITLDAQDTELAAHQLVDRLRDEEWLAAVPARARMLATGRFHRDRLAAQLAELLLAVVAGAVPATPPPASQPSTGAVP
jgi:glycosyltransferase involved in cell wall biosynthesis